MSDESKMTIGGINYSPIPIYEDGSNWLLFHRKVTNVFRAAGLHQTLEPKYMPLSPGPAPVPILDTATNGQRAAYQAAYTTWETKNEVFLKKYEKWEELQIRGSAILQLRCVGKMANMVQSLDRVYVILDKLKAARSMGTGPIIKLMKDYHGLSLASCKSVTDFGNRLHQVNLEIQDTAPQFAKSDGELILRFFFGLSSAYDIFTSGFNQVNNVTDATISFDLAVSKAFDEEQRMNNGDSAALVAHSQLNHGQSQGQDFCTHCKRFRHTEVKCFLKHPHLKKEFDERRKNRDKKRKQGSRSGGPDLKRSKTSSSASAVSNTSPSSDSGDAEITAVMHNFSCVAIDEVSVPLADTNGSNSDMVLTTSRSTSLRDDWIVDTGCTNHATGNLAHFSSIEYGDFGSCGGVGGSVRFQGKGTVLIPIPGPRGQPATLTLTDVKYCPEMGPFNLISVSQLFQGKKVKPVLGADSIHWKINGHRVNATAKHGLTT
jgi:hypothetical protein